MARIIPLYQLPVFSIFNPPDRDFDFSKGALFLIDKPIGWSSFEVVKVLRRLIGGHKTGHAGTLDPMATGLLILCCGRATRTIAEIHELPKTYRSELVFGASTPSYDKETEINQTKPYKHITRYEFQQVLNRHFRGDIWQKPSMYSAIKQDGQRLYKLAREGKKVERKPRKVTIYNAHICSFDLPKATLYIKCTSGTYIRSLVNELGKKVHSLAYLSALKRQTIGHFDLKDALTISDLNTTFS